MPLIVCKRTDLRENIYKKNTFGVFRGLKLRPEICPGFTDARYIRALGLPAFGFSPMNLTTIRLHDNDEYLAVETFVNGIKIYNKILTTIGNLQEA